MIADEFLDVHLFVCALKTEVEAEVSALDILVRLKSNENLNIKRGSLFSLGNRSIYPSQKILCSNVVEP